MNRLHTAAEQVNDPRLAADLRILADRLDERWRDLSVDFRVGGLADALTSFLEEPPQQRTGFKNASHAINAALGL